jgi:hypothetical protein
MNFNGYVREAAAKTFAGFKSPEVIPYLLLRVTDYVPNIQSIAQEIVTEKLGVFHPIEWIKHSDLIMRISKNEPIDIDWTEGRYTVEAAERHSQKYATRKQECQRNRNLLSDEIYAYIKKPQYQSAILDYLKSESIKSNLFYLQLKCDEIAHNINLCEHTLSHRLPEVRRWVIQYLSYDKSFAENISRLLMDKASRVRYHALKAIPKEERSDYRAIFEQALFDKSRKIREFARFVITELNGEDIFKGADEKIFKYYTDQLNTINPTWPTHTKNLIEFYQK